MQARPTPPEAESPDPWGSALGSGDPEYILWKRNIQAYLGSGDPERTRLGIPLPVIIVYIHAEKSE